MAVTPQEDLLGEIEELSKTLADVDVDLIRSRIQGDIYQTFFCLDLIL